MTLTKKINGVRKMIPTPHHKTGYLSKPTAKSWMIRHRTLFTELGKELGFEVTKEKRSDDIKCILILRKEGFGEFRVKLQWSKNGFSDVHVYGNCTSAKTETFNFWREGKPQSHNDARLGNWFIKLIRQDWIESNRPNIGTIKSGDEIVFSNDPSGGGQRTRAKVLSRGGEYGLKYFKVALLEERGVKKIHPVGTVMEVHYENLISVKPKPK